MKLSEFKKLIRQSVMEEINEGDNISNADSYYSFLSEEPIDENALDKIEQAIKSGKINPKTVEAAAKKAQSGDSSELAALMVTGQGFAKLEEAEEEEEITDTEVDITEPAPEAPDMGAGDMTSFASEPTYTPEEAEVMDSLDNALKQAQDLGDEKLSTLIGNIITYFTRQHVVKEGSAGRKKHYKGAVKDDKDQISKLKKDMKFDKKQLQKESLEILKMKKLAGLLKEGEYAKALLRENLDYTFEELKGKTVILALIEDGDENKEFTVINTPEDYEELERTVKKYEDEGILDEYYPVLNKGQRLREEKNLTPLQQYIYDYEIEISDKEFVDQELENIKKLNTPQDVYNYYAVYRGWEQDKDFKNDLKNIYRQVSKKFIKEENSDVYMSFDKENWFDKEDKPYAGGFDFDYDEETFDDFDSFMSKYSDKQRSFRPSDKSIFDTYKNKYNNMMMRKRK
jgi:hypothetical protein